MNVIISKADLVSLISKVQSIVPANKPTIPILANVLIEAIDDELVLSATDLIVSVRCFSSAKVLEEGAITLPARRFFQLARELTAPQVEIQSLSPEIAFINSGTSHFKIQGMHKNEFPTLPDLSDGTSFSLQTSLFKEMLARTAFAAGRDDQRQILNGILMQCQKDKAIFIGTNGKCVAKLETTLDAPFSGSYVIPIKAVEEMIKILDEKEEKTKIILMHDKIAIETGSVILITKLLSGQYPDVLRIIPKKQDNAIALHREELISLLRQVSLFTSDTSTSVRFSFSPGTLYLSAMSGEIGEGKVHMPVNYNGAKLDIAFNPHYFIDILRHSKDETISFNILDSYNPGLVSDSSEALFVIMPMRLEPANEQG
jgi:DNA polymerase III subunit beta